MDNVMVLVAIECSDPVGRLVTILALCSGLVARALHNMKSHQEAE